MDLKIQDKLFAVGGASSGLGKGITGHLINEGARVLAIGRSADKLKALQAEYGAQLSILPLDLSARDSHEQVIAAVGDHELTGAVLNAGGPPAGAALELGMDQWDAAYDSVVRWKIALTNALVPRLMKAG